jgi:hypothetical protein
MVAPGSDAVAVPDDDVEDALSDSTVPAGAAGGLGTAVAETPIDWLAVGAASHWASPDWAASTTQLPTAVKTTTPLASEHTAADADGMEKTTGRPDVAVAVVA